LKRNTHLPQLITQENKKGGKNIMKKLLNENLEENKREIDISEVLAEAKRIAEMPEDEDRELLEIDPKEEQQTMAEVKEINKILFEETIEKGEKQ